MNMEYQYAILPYCGNKILYPKRTVSKVIQVQISSFPFYKFFQVQCANKTASSNQKGKKNKSKTSIVT